MILLTPRQHATYSALYLLTGEGQHAWTGNLHRHLPGLTDNNVKSDLKRLRALGIVSWIVVGCCRRFTVLMHRDELGMKEPTPNKLQSKPAIGYDPAAAQMPAQCRSYTPTDGASAGVRWDDGRFSAAFREAFPAKDYKGAVR